MDERVYRVAIVGGGFSGIGVAIRLLSDGVRDFVILERADRLGGTWRDNTYPGCACDVPSQLYSFSFAPNPDWSRVFAPGPEIQRYLLDVAGRHGIEPHVRYRCEVRAARWDEGARRWELDTSGGRVRAEVLVAAAGPLHQPRLPDVPGLERFQGVHFHTARWDAEHDLAGRRVAVIGTGSSAIQLVPEVQPRVARLVLFQRTAPWVLPKPDHAYPALERAAFRHLPGFRLAYRGAIWGGLELLQLAQRRPAVMRQLQRVGLLHLRRQVADPALRRQLTPTFVLGCKRILLSNSYYPALQRPNVTVVPQAVARISERGVVSADGIEHPVDTIVFATGFRVTDPPIAERVFGREGRSLRDVWRGSPQAYLGTCVAGFPNLFLMIGPNLGNGHSSAFLQIEAQAGYVAAALRTMARERLASVEVRPSVQAAYNARLQAALAGTVWNAGGCGSYYLDANGRNASIYPWSTVDMRRRLARFDLASFQARPRPDAPARPPGPLELEGAVAAVTGGARGIGLAVARALIARGARVALGDLDPAAAAEAAAALGPRARAYRLDVARRESFAAFLDAVASDLGPLELLVNNAGVMPAGPFLAEADESGAAAMAVNYGGTALGMKLALPGMVARGHGHVVNVISMAGKLPVPGLGSYVASKHAALGLTAVVRDELRGSGVTVSAVLPGAVRTRLSAGIPLGGLFAREPEDVARAVLESCRTRAPEVAVPAWLGLYPRLDALLPAATRLLRRALRDGRVLAERDGAARGAYEAELARQGRDATEAPADPVGAAR